MKKRKIISNILAWTILATSLVSLGGCDFYAIPKKPTTDVDTDTQEASEIMNKAVEKIETVSEMMFGSITTNETEATNYERGLSGSSVATMSANMIPSDVAFGMLSRNETVIRQLYVNYPYNIVNYMMQNTTKAHKRYNHKYKVGETVYGVATKTINNSINSIFENPDIPSPKLSVNVQKEKDAITFSADWDWRNSILQAHAPQYNSVIMTNGRVEYDHNTKQIDKIMMTWYWTELNGDFMASVMDFEKSEFYFMEGWRHGVWNGMSTVEDIPDVFNRGELTYEKLSEYAYSGIHVIQSNITENAEDLRFTALDKTDSNLNSTGALREDTLEKEATFAQFYNETYGKVQGLKMRNKSDSMSLDGAIEVNFMNDAASYGLNRTKCTTHAQGTDFMFIEYDDLQAVLSDLASENAVKNNAVLLSLVGEAKNCLDELKHCYIGELGEYNGKNYTLNFVLNGEQKVDSWRIWSDKLFYQLSDGESSITFELQDGKLVDIVSTTV